MQHTLKSIALYALCGASLIGVLGAGHETAAQEMQKNRFASVPVALTANVSYGPDTQEILDICRPSDTSRQHPGLIMIHGGGWTRGDKGGLMGKWCQRFAQMGFVVASIDYRLASEQGGTPGWPAFQVGDVQLAIRWMRAHAAELGLDPGRLCAYGTSAGGYLAVYAGTLQTVAPSDVAAINPHISVALSCVVDGFGPVDLVNPQFAVKAFEKLIGGSYHQYPDVYKADSPLFRVNASTPPMLVIHGNQDGTVPIAQSEELVAALKQNNVPVQFITYDGNHAYKGQNPQGLDDVFQQIAAYLQSRIGR